MAKPSSAVEAGNNSLHSGWLCARQTIVVIKEGVKKYRVTTSSLCHANHTILKIMLAHVMSEAGF